MPVTFMWSTQDSAFNAAGDLDTQEAEHILELDTVGEQHSADAQVTERPIEGAASISDHKRPGLLRLSLECLVSNTPIGAPLASGYGSPIIDTRTQETDAGVVTGFTDAFDTVGEVLATLERLRSEPTLLVVDTDRRTYESMTVVSVNDNRQPGQGSGFASVSIELVEVRVVETARIDSPEPRESRASRRRDDGAQDGSDNAATDRQLQSALAQATDAITEGLQGFFERDEIPLN